MEIIFGFFLMVAAFFFFRGMRSARPVNTERDSPPAKPEARARLTNAQMTCLSCASFDKAIYGEHPSHRFSQMPNDADCFALRTVESLEKRGFLRSDGRGGYLLTEEGQFALRSAMGF